MDARQPCCAPGKRLMLTAVPYSTLTHLASAPPPSAFHVHHTSGQLKQWPAQDLQISAIKKI